MLDDKTTPNILTIRNVTTSFYGLTPGCLFMEENNSIQNKFRVLLNTCSLNINAFVQQLYKFVMVSILHFHVLVFLCKILEGQTIVWDENFLSRPVITRNHRWLKVFAFNTFHSASLVSCGLQCQRNPRCVSTNFRKTSSLDKTKSKTKGICELNDRGVPLSMEEKELERDKESVYTQFYDIKVKENIHIFFVLRS